MASTEVPFLALFSHSSKNAYFKLWRNSIQWGITYKCMLPLQIPQVPGKRRSEQSSSSTLTGAVINTRTIFLLPYTTRTYFPFWWMGKKGFISSPGCRCAAQPHRRRSQRRRSTGV